MRTKYDNVFINPTMDDVGAHRAMIAFDLDSVLNVAGYDIGQAIADNWDLKLSDVRAVDPVDGHEKFHFEVAGASYKEVAHVVDKFILERSVDCGQSPYMQDVMWYIHRALGNEPITVITARRHEAVDVTYEWLKRNLMVPFICYIVNGEPKSKALSYLNTKIFVDDRWKTINGLTNQIPWPVLYRRPWNQGRSVRLPVVEVNTLRDVIPLFNILTGRVPTEWPRGLSFPKP